MIDYVLKDIDLADFGRKELDIVETEQMLDTIFKDLLSYFCRK